MRVAVGLVWLLSWLPFRAVAALAWLLGSLIFLLPTARRHVGAVNLRLCLPELPASERRQLLRRNFVAMVQMLLEYGWCWFGSRERLRALMKIEGQEHLQALAGKPVILMTPHFTGLELAGLRVSLETPVVDIYSRQKNAWLDAFMHARRLRFDSGVVFSRQQGTRPVIRAVREGYRLFYLPDQDHGHRDSVFVPFFGVTAATITGLSRLAKATGATVLPCYARRERDGYTLVIEPPLAGFPSDDVQADALRMNQLIERQIRRQPHQYFWMHRRFKSRPPGEPDLYAKP